MTFLFDDDVPDDLSHLLNHVGHRVTFMRDDFVKLGSERPHGGIVIVIRRRSRAHEGVALPRLVERATEAGLANNITLPPPRRRAPRPNDLIGPRRSRFRLGPRGLAVLEL